MMCWRLQSERQLRRRSPAQILRDALMLGCGREYEARKTANMLASTQACEAAEEECEAVLEREQSGTLPSTGKSPVVGPLPGSTSVYELCLGLQAQAVWHPVLPQKSRRGGSTASGCLLFPYPGH